MTITNLKMSPEEKDLLYQIHNDLKEIKRYMYNDELTGQVGAIQKIDQIENRVKKLEESNKIEAAKKALLLFIGGVIVTIGQWLLRLLTE